MTRILVLAAAGALTSTAALAQMSPAPLTGNLDASTEAQIELQEPDEGNLPSLREVPQVLPDIDFGTTQSIRADNDAFGDFSANARNSENLRGR